MARVTQLIRECANALQRYTLARFVKLTDKKEQISVLFTSPANDLEKATAGLKIDEIVENNIVLRNYGDQLNKEALESSICLVVDIRNKGYASLVESHTKSLLAE